MVFPDPLRPIATCSADSCENCPVSEKIHCHFQLRDLLHFLLISLPGFIIGGAAIYKYTPWFIGLYIVILIGFFGLLEIRVMCSHCPHYAENGKTLACWANHGSPKLWKYRPGPMSRNETVLFFGGLVTVWGFPIPFFLLTDSWLLLILYALTNTAFFATLKVFLCAKCMNFACPLNGVSPEDRKLFLDRNPSVQKHWTA